MIFEKDLAKLKEQESELKRLEEKSKNNIFEDNKERILALKEKNKLLFSLENYFKYKEISKSISQLELELNTPEIDKNFSDYIKNEIHNLESQKSSLEKKISDDLNPELEILNSNVFVEISSGIGGSEAAIFASDLYRMYLKYFVKKDWKINEINQQKTSSDGYSNLLFEVKGTNVYKTLRYESGIHRVQRIPKTESNGRVHTSTARVHVFPQKDSKDMGIKDEDIRIDTYRSSGAGGQHTNKTDSAIRITHIPTGIVVQSQNERSQHRNKDIAMNFLQLKINEYMLERESSEKNKNKKENILNAERSEKVRTYNYPQNRITDHRASISKNLDKIMGGDMEGFLIEISKKIND